MTHPSGEDWMSYLYDELPATARSRMRDHLEACEECRVKLEGWERMSRSLDEFTLPRHSHTSRQSRLSRWAIAAGFVAFAAAGAMHVAALNREVKQLRAEFNAVVTQERGQQVKGVNAEVQALITAVAQRLEAQRLADHQTTLGALQRLTRQHAEDYTALRVELETVAILTEAGLQRAQNQIATIAYSPDAISNNK